MLKLPRLHAHHALQGPALTNQGSAATPQAPRVVPAQLACLQRVVGSSANICSDCGDDIDCWIDCAGVGRSTAQRAVRCFTDSSYVVAG